MKHNYNTLQKLAQIQSNDFVVTDLLELENDYAQISLGLFRKDKKHNDKLARFVMPPEAWYRLYIALKNYFNE